MDLVYTVYEDIYYWSRILRSTIPSPYMTSEHEFLCKRFTRKDHIIYKPSDGFGLYMVLYGHRLTDLEFLDRFFKNTSCKIAMSGLAGIGRRSRFTSWLTFLKNLSIMLL